MYNYFRLYTVYNIPIGPVGNYRINKYIILYIVAN